MILLSTTFSHTNGLMNRDANADREWLFTLNKQSMFHVPPITIDDSLTLLQNIWDKEKNALNFIWTKKASISWAKLLFEDS